MPALKRHVRLAGEIENQQSNKPQQVNERQTVAVTDWTMLENKNSHARAKRRVDEIAGRRKLPKRESERCGLRSKTGHASEHEKNPP